MPRQVYLHSRFSSPTRLEPGGAMYIPMNTIHSYFLSKFLLTSTLPGDVRVDVTGVPDQLPVEGAGSADAAAAWLWLSEAKRGLPFYLMALH